MNNPSQAPGAPISEALAADFAKRFTAFFDGPQLGIANEIFATDYVSHLPLAPDLPLENFKDYVASFYEAVPDFKQIVNQVIISKDRLVLHVTYVGTQTGPLFGVPPTGKNVAMNGIGIFRFNAAGLAVENWAVIDVAGMMAQIGAFPPPASR